VKKKIVELSTSHYSVLNIETHTDETYKVFGGCYIRNIETYRFVKFVIYFCCCNPLLKIGLCSNTANNRRTIKISGITELLELTAISI